MSTTTTSSQRKSSMSMADLEAIHEERTMNNTTTPVVMADNSNVDVFQEICQDVEQEDMNAKTKKMTRRASQDENDVVDHPTTSALPTATRRHSGYESRMRRDFRQSHTDAKEYYLATTGSPHAERRASFVNSMLEFNLSLSMSQVDVDPSQAAAMQLSCPVLSYMNDEEEDSVELRMMKRPSMTHVMGEEDESQYSWEALEEAESSNNNNMQQSREYVIELPPLEDELAPKKRRRRKPHSYKVLEQQLKEQSPLEVLKQFNESFQMPQQEEVQPQPRPVVAATMPPKSLEHDLRHVLASPPPQQPMAASRPAAARGA